MALSRGNGWTIPELADVLDARRAIAPYLQRTPLTHTRGSTSFSEPRRT
jgi:hypothetical protein